MDSGDFTGEADSKNDHEATLMVQNKTKQPLSIKLPDAFVGTPVLAQAAPVNGGGITRNRTTTNE